MNEAGKYTMTEGKGIKVKIFGAEYPLRGESEDLTKKVASYVDEMISTIHEKIPEQPPLTIAVLSALNITEDLFKERDRNRTLLSFAETEISRIGDYLEQSLNG
jgi:cell division protein ZapA